MPRTEPVNNFGRRRLSDKRPLWYRCNVGRPPFIGAPPILPGACVSKAHSMSSNEAEEKTAQPVLQPDQDRNDSDDYEARVRDLRAKMKYLRALFAAKYRRQGSTSTRVSDWSGTHKIRKAQIRK
jgi:hypothetical protein